MENVRETSAKTLSKNKIKKISEKQILVCDESKNSNFFDNNGISNKPLNRGWYDIASLNLRYIDSKIFNKYCPSNEKKKKFIQSFCNYTMFVIRF